MYESLFGGNTMYEFFQFVVIPIIIGIVEVVQKSRTANQIQSISIISFRIVFSDFLRGYI